MTSTTRRIAVPLLALALLFLAVQGQATQPAARIASNNAHRTALDAAVDATATDYFRSTCHVGLSLAVVNRDGSFFYDYGSSVRGATRLPDRHSVYEIASVTKTFTGALTAHAVADGRMTLDGDFRAHLPAPYPNLAWHGTPITLRSLLTHRSGLPRDIPDTDAIFAKKDVDTLPRDLLALQDGFDRTRSLSALHDVHLRSKPGDAEAYSNAGFFVLGAGLEQVYGQPFDALLQSTLLGPLGMTSTGVALDRSMQVRRVPPHDRRGRVVSDHPSNAGAAWGLYSTSEDMAKYVGWLLDADDPVARLLRRPLVGTSQDGVAMTWHLANEASEPVMYHGGGSFGMSAQVVLYPKGHEGFALLANDACEGTESALKAMAAAIHSHRHGVSKNRDRGN